MIGIKSTLGMFLEEMGQEMFAKGARRTRIYILDIGGMKHSKEKEWIQV